MVSGFLCGTSSFPREEDEYERRQTRSADSSPRRSRSSKSSHNKNNPYSTRGLDKFTALLAEIEEKRQQIYSRVDPDEISLVRFVYSGDHDVKPIVVKANKPNHHDTIKLHKSQELGQKPSQIINKLQSSKSMNVKEDNNKAEIEVNNKKKNKKMGCYQRNLRINQWKESVLVIPVIFILILMFLVVFGRSFTIMCTSIGWYVIPATITNKNANSSTTNNLKKKKDYAIQRLIDKKLINTSQGTKSFKS